MSSPPPPQSPLYLASVITRPSQNYNHLVLICGSHWPASPSDKTECLHFASLGQDAEWALRKCPPSESSNPSPVFK